MPLSICVYQHGKTKTKTRERSDLKLDALVLIGTSLKPVDFHFKESSQRHYLAVDLHLYRMNFPWYKTIA